MDRRTFLKSSAGVTLSGLAWMATGCASESDSSSAAATDTSAAGTRSLPALGVQLYTVRSLMEDDFEGTLQSVADIGFDHVEFAGYYERSPEEVCARLDDLGLAAPSAHVPLEPLRNDLDGVIQTAQAVGHEYVICPWLPEEERASIANYRALAQFFNEVGGQMRDAGLQFGYHNHAFEFEAIDGTRPYDVLLDETDPEHVTMELDLYWIREAGFDPLTYFADYPGRFALAHVKDRADDGTMLPVGQGAIDFAAIFAQSEQAGLQHYVVEHDNPDDPLTSIRTSHDYLRQLRF